MPAANCCRVVIILCEVNPNKKGLLLVLLQLLKIAHPNKKKLRLREEICGWRMAQPPCCKNMASVWTGLSLDRGVGRRILAKPTRNELAPVGLLRRVFRRGRARRGVQGAALSLRRVRPEGGAKGSAGHATAHAAGALPGARRAHQVHPGRLRRDVLRSAPPAPAACKDRPTVSAGAGCCCRLSPRPSVSRRTTAQRGGSHCHLSAESLSQCRAVSALQGRTCDSGSLS